MVSAVAPDLAKIIEKVCISRHFWRPETDLHIAENACWIDYADTWSSKWVHRLSKCKNTIRSTAHYGCENAVEFKSGVAWASLPITRIHPWVALESEIQWLLTTLHNTEWLDPCQVSHGCFKTIPTLDPVDVGNAYGYSVSCHDWHQWHVRSYGLRYTSIN